MITFELFPTLTGQGIIIALFLSFCAAGLEIFFRYCMEENMIFEFWSDFVYTLNDKGGLYKKLAFILGYCIFCNGFWVSVLIYIAYYREISLFTLLFGALSIIFIRMFILLGFKED
jgi:hypothetical protein